MSLRHTLLFAAFATSSALGADAGFANGLIPTELAGEIAGYQNPQFFQALPDGFPLPASLPPGLQLRLLGGVQQGIQQRLFLHSPRSGSTVLGGLHQAYLDAGWVDLSSALTGSTLTRLCRDGVGELQITSPRARQGTTSIEAYYVNYNNAAINASGLKCSDQAAQLAFRTALQTRGDALFPLLEVPASTLPSGSYGLPRSLSYGGTADGFSLDLERKGSIEVPGMDLAALFEHFAEQLRSQGWERDSGSVGLRSASSVWYRAGAAAQFSDLSTQPVTVHGSFVIIDHGADRYHLSFAMGVQGGRGSSGGFGVIGVHSGL